jgi:rhodanese-related sulfurtransferase
VLPACIAASHPRADDVAARFAEGGVATPREAVALLRRDFRALDVRTERERAGPGAALAGAAHVPLIHATWQEPADARAQPATQAVNADFLAQVSAAFPEGPIKAKIVVHCSDGRGRSVAALRACEAAGYSRLVGIRGGWAGGAGSRAHGRRHCAGRPFRDRSGTVAHHR